MRICEVGHFTFPHRLCKFAQVSNQLYVAVLNPVQFALNSKVTNYLDRGDFTIDVMMYDLPKDVQEVLTNICMEQNPSIHTQIVSHLANMSKGKVRDRIVWNHICVRTSNDLAEKPPVLRVHHLWT